MDLFSHKSKKRVELICDIGSGSIGISFVEFEDSLSPNVLYSERVPISPLGMISSTGMHASLSREFQEALSRGLNHAVSKNIKPQAVHCFYSSPWFMAQSHLLKLKQAEPFIFTEEVLRKMIKDGEQHFLSAEEKYVAPLSLEDMKLVERRVTRIKLNGYETHQPFGKKVTEAEAAVFLSALSKKSVSKVEEAVKRHWAGLQIQHHTWAMVSFAVIRNMHDAHSSFLILRVSSEVTDVYLVHDGCLLETMSFPMGKRTIVRGIEKDCNLDQGLASSALSLYIKDEIHEGYSEKLKISIDSAKNDWLAHVENVFGEILKDNPVPPVLYIISDEDNLPFFETAIRKNILNGHKIQGFEFQVFPVKKEAFDAHLLYSSSIYKDFILDSEALYLNFLSGIKSIITNNDYVIE